MLDGLRQFIADIVSPDAQQGSAFDETDYRLAATALLIHVVSLDGEPTAKEKRKLHSLIETRFKLDPRHRGPSDRLRHPGRGRCGRSLSFHQRHHARGDEEGRLRIVEMMWEMVFADGKVTEFEDNVRLARGRSARHFVARPDRSQAPRRRAAGGRRPTANRTRPTQRLRRRRHRDVAGACTRHDENLMCRAIRRRVAR